MSDSSASTLHQTLIGAGAIVLAGTLAYGAVSISSSAGYSGVGPNFMPWLISVVLMVCGVWLVWERERLGKFRLVERGFATLSVTDA